MRYPSTTRLDLVETLHGVQVTDPYRWLEDPATPETVAWSQAQAELFDGWMAGCPGRRVLRDRVGRLLAAGLVSAPAVRERWFFERRRGDQEHPVLLVREADGFERVLIDPSALSEEGTVTLDGWFVSLEGTRLAYQLSEGGDEEPLLWVLDVGTGEVVEGPIERTRSTGVSGATASGSPPTATCWCSGKGARRPSTTTSTSPTTAAGWSSAPLWARRRATTSTSPTCRATGSCGRSRRASTPRPGAGSSATGGCGCGPAWAPRASGWWSPTRPIPRPATGVRWSGNQRGCSTASC